MKILKMEEIRKKLEWQYIWGPSKDILLLN